MAISKLERTLFINAEPARVFDQIADPHNYVGLQPLLLRVTNIVYDQDAQGNPVCWYETVELFRPFGLIRYENKIRVRMVLMKQARQIDAEVWSPFNVHLFSTLCVRPEGSGTRVVEAITVKMPAIFKSIVVSQANKAQEKKLANLKIRLESA